MRNSISRSSFARMLDTERRKTPSKSFVATESLSGHAFDSINEVMASSSAPAEINQDNIQSDIRTAFHKIGINNGTIGTHPDFLALAETDAQENHYICSLFLDIKNSTRLTFIYDLPDVVAIKNTILKAAAETVRALDGHVHRFMGDALLAFFGGKTQSKEDSIVNAINCTSVLEALMTGTIIPVLEQTYSQDPKADYLGFRIGLDYGSDENVLWASYGVKGVYEVTPTSFYVDVAAKLQGIAGKNKAMLGDSILSEIDFPEAYTKIRTRTQTNSQGNQETIPTPILPRTYTDREGKQHKYKVRELLHTHYRDLLPFTPELKEALPNSRSVSCSGISFKCYKQTDDQLIDYPSVSSALEKRSSLKFKLTLEREVYTTQKFPLELQLIKTNHGKEAQSFNKMGIFRLPKKTIFRDTSSQSRFFTGDSHTHHDSTAYRGLHTMEAIVTNANGVVIFRDFIGVYIK
ncbi:adenylate/guanylate cyclase domain-containing protein [Pseudomonas sp. 32.2.56]|uniref:adenylate/guanylate cyclase domain-containing protein n=1 Tax=Pseudomonas sp. 32.2.56 TaxID=2969303 RepID=UPI00214F6D03|nr:adenylate/guanylate cyclase domain-containing protein [Pseudomonas sp. 32.2.56]MCR4510576.1 adenylate/guanylate cyclase domain-containing protein [Pseudomonas sp. 32.2.56]